jgi:hypothetical protein
MLAAFNTTAVAASAVTAVTAMATSLIGYRMSRLSANVAEHQIDAESGRQREQLGEARRRERQDVYRVVLNADHRLLDILDQPEFEQETAQIAYTDVVEAVNDAIIFGTHDVAQAAANYQVLVGLVIHEAGIDEDVEWYEAAIAATERHGAAWMKRRADLFNAMRRDVAVDSTEIAFYQPHG